ncbi:MAG TPA: glycine oxidase ThiO [Capsulimonadaceae bacterium]|nr:glycine oxidase ThiO [Capsulimonadaceae bacterium]
MAGSDVVIVGAGVIGLSIAWKLAQGGASVTVIDKGPVGHGASWAAAGMLAPFAESRDDTPFARLTIAGLKAYPGFVESLESETGIDTELSRVGLLRIALDEADESALRATFEGQCAGGLPVQWLNGDQARELEPNLSPALRAAILSPEEWHIEPRKLTRALAVACAARGVCIVQETPVDAFQTAGDKITAVNAGGTEITAGKIVLAGGAWSGVSGKTLGVSLPVFPVRGQILALGPCLPHPVRHTIYAHHGYLVPKADGRIVVGATQEDAGFDNRPTCAGVGELLAMAPKFVPSLAEMPIESIWAGLRPAASDSLPIMGILHGYENAYVATGHFRNGILLAPITGALMASLILRGDVSPLLQGFSPDRFREGIR